jgi:spore coat polysaccharide biosynthesis protein SpsF
MKKVIIVQARMTSSRLPGKVMMDLAGRPMLSQQIRRLKACREMDEIVIATTTNSTDDPVVALAETEGLRWFRGSESDVLSRYVGAAHEAKAEIVVRITADCPLIDPEQSDAVVSGLSEVTSEYDYASNCLTRTLPKGLDTEALFLDTLDRVNRMATSRSAREHVTWFIHTERPDLFAFRSITSEEDNSDLRWTVDTLADFQSVTKIYEDLNLGERQLPYREILASVRSHQNHVAGRITN